MLTKKIPLKIAVLIAMLSVLLTYFLSALTATSHVETIARLPAENKTDYCRPDFVRLAGYEFVRPILYKEDVCESKDLLGVKSEIENLIYSYKASGIISSASVYLRQLNQGEYVSIEDAENYNPGSLLKIPELITFMKMRERDPGLFDQKINYSKALTFDKHGVFLSRSIELGKTYTIRELLYYMIAYSDNYATMLLNQRMDLNIFRKLFTDIGLAEPDMSKSNVPLTARAVSLFLRILYNAAYLNINDSEYCMELLSHGDFDKGMLKGIPAGIKVSHKFGEASDGVNAHLGESGIIFFNHAPYLLTIMTKGSNLQLLPEVISDISEKIFAMIARL